MKPEDVPQEAVTAFCQTFWGASTAETRPAMVELARTTLAAVLPAHTERVLAAAADQLDAMPETDGAALSGPFWYRDGWKQATNMLRDWADYPPALADRIARGES